LGAFAGSNPAVYTNLITDYIHMKKVASSPERHTFQKEGAIRRAEEAGEEPNQAYIDMWEQIKIDEANQIHDPEWQRNNMEYDLRSSKELCDKAKASDAYAQNLYAAMCNMTWQSREFWQEMKGETWSCSWRHSGGIVSDMREQGDYIDWYCSGIGNEELGNGLTGADGTNYVPEGTITEEIELDLNRLGWRPVPWTNDE
jgi:hypothetical protein